MSENFNHNQHGRSETDLSRKTYQYLIEGRNRGYTFRQLIDASIGSAVDDRLYCVTDDIEGAHAFLLIQNRLDLIRDHLDEELSYA
jgi:hypothetical protein